MVRLAVAGGGISGSALISLLRGDSSASLVGVFESKTEAPGVVLARKWNIPVYSDLESFVASNPEVVVNVSGDPELSDKIRSTFKYRIEVIEGVGARFLWEIIEKQKRAKIEVIKTLADQKIIYTLSAQLCAASSSEEYFSLLLAKTLDIMDAPAGSITVYDGKRMRLAASKGLSRRFLESNPWDLRPGGIADHVFQTKEYIELADLQAGNYTDAPVLIAEKIKSVLAYPVTQTGKFSGILYIDDFKPRQYSERQKASLALVTGVMALALDRFGLIKELEEFRLKFISKEFDETEKPIR